MKRLIELYRKTKGGHAMLSDSDFEEYSELRKKEFQDRRTELIEEGKINVNACKDDAGDIIGWTYEENETVEETPKI